MQMRTKSNESPMPVRIVVCKKRGLLATLIVPCFTTMLTACAPFSPRDMGDPQEVTITQALKDIGQGFSEMKQALGAQVLGLYPCEVKVTLNVKASAKEAGGLVIDLSSKPRSLEGHSAPIDPAAKAGFEKTSEANAERGNTVDIRLYNPGCLPKGTLGYEKPEALDQAQQGMAFTGREGHYLNRFHKLCVDQWPQCLKNRSGTGSESVSTTSQQRQNADAVEAPMTQRGGSP